MRQRSREGACLLPGNCDYAQGRVTGSRGLASKTRDALRGSQLETIFSEPYRY